MILAKETLRNLDEAALTSAAGGTFPDSEGPAACCTASCCAICAAPDVRRPVKRGKRGAKDPARIHTR